MNQEELEKIREQGKLPRIEKYCFETHDNVLCIDNKVCFPVYAIESSIPNKIDLEIFFDSISIGVLCFCKQLGESNVAELTDYQFAAYLGEVSKDSYLDLTYRFEYDYVVIDLPYLKDYKNKLMESSAIWGGFSHDKLDSFNMRSLKRIDAKSGIQFPTKFHKNQASRAVLSSHTFDRYLKIYHQLELLFDWIIVKNIQKMGEDLYEIANTMSLYKSGDLDRLTNLIKDYVKDKREIELLIYNAFTNPTHLDKAKLIFQNFSKNGNHLAKDKTWVDFIGDLNSGIFRINEQKNIKLQEKYNDTFLKIVAYWIFRIRCCIAHNRIGEYVMTDADLDFVQEFAEPLLKQIVFQVLSNPDIHSLMANSLGPNPAISP